MNQKNTELKKATFAGGCFWCMESPFLKHQGVEEVISGYTGGHVENPTYQQVTSGQTGHYEAVQITYNPEEISYRKLLDIFWQQIDPTDPGGSFVDRGPQYRTAIFVQDQEQRRAAEASLQNLDDSGKFSQPIATNIIDADTFYPAEDYHQKFFLKNPFRYQTYRKGSGREKYIEETWGEK